MTVELAQKDKAEYKAGPIPKDAIDYFNAKNLHPAFNYHEVWAAENHFAFTVAKILEKSILSDVRDSIEKALLDGVPFEKWSTDIRPSLEKSGWAQDAEGNEPSRLRTIYDTNMRMARANGQEDRAQRVKDVLPFFVYELGPSKEHRIEHQEWAGLTLEVDDPWWDEHAPPSAWGCKCRRRQVTQTEADEGTGPDDAPPDDDEPYEIKDASGEVVRSGMVPRGVDPAFAYKKGTAGRQQALADALESDE